MTKKPHAVTARGPTHPGEFLRKEVLPSLKITVADPAKELGIAHQTLHLGVTGEMAITPANAPRTRCGASWGSPRSQAREVRLIGAPIATLTGACSGDASPHRNPLLLPHVRYMASAWRIPMQQKKLIILLADISGYTQFMLDSATSAVHGQMAINALIESIIAQIDIPLMLQEIEGDAVFLYAADPGTEEDWQRAVRDVSRKLDTFFTAFMAQLAITAESTPCACAVCGNFEKLGLKIIVHAGEAMFHSVAGRAQVSGPDVILAHRLLKNSLPSHEYLLLSDQAYALMRSHIADNFERHVEKYEGFGDVSVHVRFLHEDFLKARDAIYHLNESEHQSAVDGYLHRATQSHARARRQQHDHPARKFRWWERLPLIIEALMAPLALPIYRRLITRQQRTRGSRRER